MIKACLSCGIEKDLTIEVIYPYDDDCLTREIPLPPLLVIECQGEIHNEDDSWDFRAAIMCHNCWHRLVTTRGIDMWIGQKCWESLNPITPFAHLPKIHENINDKWQAENY